MEQSPKAMKVPPTPPARLPVSRLVAILAGILAIAAFVAAVCLTIGAAQQRSGLGMVCAAGALLICVLSLMVAIQYASRDAGS